MERRRPSMPSPKLIYCRRIQIQKCGEEVPRRNHLLRNRKPKMKTISNPIPFQNSKVKHQNLKSEIIYLPFTLLINVNVKGYCQIEQKQKSDIKTGN